MPHRILVVEDDVAIQGFAKTILEGAGFAVDISGSATKALQSFRAVRPDMVIVDIGLPDGNGLELAKSMGLGRGSLPFLFLTARNDLETRLKCFGYGAQDYIQKPFAVEELLARVKVHLDIKKSHDALARRNYELELMNRARQDLTDMIVHDLKTPLTSIKGTLELINEHRLISNAAYQKLLEYAGTAAEFMLLMLNDLLDIGQAEQTGLHPELATVDVPALFKKLEALFASRCERLEQAVTFDIDKGLGPIVTDQNLVFRVLVNLISNAMNASVRAGKVEVSCRHKDGNVRFEVADRGCGVPDSEKLRIFEKYSTSKSAPDEGSRGIGLTFCRLAAYALKGKIWVEDRPGGGSVFVVDVGLAAAKGRPVRAKK